MDNNFKIDSLDKKILSLLIKNARMPYLEIARECKVTGSAIHQRMQKMKDAGLLEGFYLNINPKSLAQV